MNYKIYTLECKFVDMYFPINNFDFLPIYHNFLFKENFALNWKTNFIIDLQIFLMHLWNEKIKKQIIIAYL